VYLNYINFRLNQSKMYVAKCQKTVIGVRKLKFDILKNFNIFNYDIKSSLNNANMKFY